MVSDILKDWDDFDFEAFFSSVNKEDIERILQKETLSDRDFLSLLSPSADSSLEYMAWKARALTERQFGKTINLYTPLYLSDYCSNRCLYCGFNKDQKHDRRQLTLDEIREEGEAISSTGLKHILLLTGGDREKTPLSYIADAVSLLRPLFSSISVEIYALTGEEYRLLTGCGVDHVTIYQETYNRELYGKYHLEGEKADYDFRLNAPERAAAAGAHSVNLGALLGLGDPAPDFFKAALHGNYIRKKYPATSVAMSFPRLRPASGGLQPPFPLSDRDLVRFMTAFRLYIPRAEISISTRESASLRNSLLPFGVTKMSADSRTSVGGRLDDEGHEQFSVSDTRTVEQLDSDLRLAGYQPVYRDWISL